MQNRRLGCPRHVRSSPDSDRTADIADHSIHADFVAEIRMQNRRGRGDCHFEAAHCHLGLYRATYAHDFWPCNAYATHKGRTVVAGRPTPSLRTFCRCFTQHPELELSTAWPAQSQPAEPQGIRFKCANNISTRFLSRPDSPGACSLGQRPGNVALPRRCCAGFCGRTPLDNIVP